MDAVFFGETLDQVISMLPDALHEIAGNADVKRSISLAGEDVNGGLQDLWLLEGALNPLQQIFGPADFCNQWLQFWLACVNAIKVPHVPQVAGRKSVRPRKLGLQIASQIFNHAFAPAQRQLPLADVLAQPPVQRKQFCIGRPQGLELALANLRLDFKQEVAIAGWRQ